MGWEPPICYLAEVPLLLRLWMSLELVALMLMGGTYCCYLLLICWICLCS